MAELRLLDERERTLALLAAAELEHFRCGAMRLCLLFGTAVCVLAAVVLPVWTLPGDLLPVSLAAAISGAGGLLFAARHASAFYWQLARRPWRAALLGLLVSVLLAAEGLGSSVLYFPALTLVVLPICINRPRWGWITALTLFAAPNLFSVLMHLAGLHTGFGLTADRTILQDVGLLLVAAVFWRLIEHQARHVPVAFLRMASVAASGAGSLGERRVLPPADMGFAQGDGDGGDDAYRQSRRSALGLPAPAPERDLAQLARSQLGLSSRELEVMLLLLGGVEEQEIGLRLAWVTPGRQREVARSTVNKHIDSAKRKIAAVHGASSVTTTQAAALVQAALDHGTASTGTSDQDAMATRT